MRALTIRQPWAWAIAAGHKPIENRSWTTDHRGEVAIHAGRRWDQRGAEDPRIVKAAADAAAGATLGALLVLAGSPQITPLGALVAVADLTHICSAAIRGNPCDCGPWAQPGEWHWQLANIRPLSEPVLCSGRQGLWHTPLAADAALERAALSAHLPAGETTP